MCTIPKELHEKLYMASSYYKSKNHELSFMKQFSTDPCPPGMKNDPNRLGYCIAEAHKFTGFYTKETSRFRPSGSPYASAGLHNFFLRE